MADRIDQAGAYDVAILRKVEEAKARRDLSSIPTAELRRYAELTKLQPSHSEGFLKTADKVGVPEMLGAGAASFTPIPGDEFVGAGIGRGVAETIKNIFGGQDKPAEDIAGDMLWSASGPAVVRGAGRLATNSGRASMRSALPITEEMAEAAAGPGGRLATHRGVDSIVTDILNERGMTPKRMFDVLDTRLSSARADDLAARNAADARGVTINPQDIADAAQDRLNTEVRGQIHSPGQISGAESVVDEFLADAGARTRQVNVPLNLGQGQIGGTITQQVPPRPMTAGELREKLARTPFQPEASEAAGTKAGVTAVRKEASRAYKNAVPDAEGPMKTQAETIPKMELIDKLLSKPGSSAQGEVLLSGFKPRVFGMIGPSPSSRFTMGKTLNAIGQFLEGKNVPSKVILPRGAPAGSGELLAILTEALAGED